MPSHEVLKVGSLHKELPVIFDQTVDHRNATFLQNDVEGSLGIVIQNDECASSGSFLSNPYLFYTISLEPKFLLASWKNNLIKFMS